MSRKTTTKKTTKTTEPDFDEMLVSELKALCKKRKLPTNGLKSEIIARLRGEEPAKKSKGAPKKSKTAKKQAEDSEPESEEKPVKKSVKKSKAKKPEPETEDSEPESEEKPVPKKKGKKPEPESDVSESDEESEEKPAPKRAVKKGITVPLDSEPESDEESEEKPAPKKSSKPVKKSKSKVVSSDEESEEKPKSKVSKSSKKVVESEESESEEKPKSKVSKSSKKSTKKVVESESEEKPQPKGAKKSAKKVVESEQESDEESDVEEKPQPKAVKKSAKKVAESEEEESSEQETPVKKGKPVKKEKVQENDTEDSLQEEEQPDENELTTVEEEELQDAPVAEVSSTTYQISQEKLLEALKSFELSANQIEKFIERIKDFGTTVETKSEGETAKATFDRELNVWRLGEFAMDKRTKSVFGKILEGKILALDKKDASRLEESGLRYTVVGQKGVEELLQAIRNEGEDDGVEGPVDPVKEVENGLGEITIPSPEIDEAKFTKFVTAQANIEAQADYCAICKEAELTEAEGQEIMTNFKQYVAKYPAVLPSTKMRKVKAPVNVHVERKTLKK